MPFDGIWRLTEPPMQGDDQVKLIQQKALRAFASYAVPLGVKVNGVYDEPTAAFIGEYQDRKNASGHRPVLPANPTAQRGDCDYATKQALGVLPMAPSPSGPKPPKYVGYACPGTWGTWNIGPQCMAVNRTPNVWVQGVQWDTSAFLNPNPQHSYIEARAEGTAELLRLALPDPRPKIISGYSMGADVVVRFLHAWPAERRDEIKGVFTFGSPGRPPGATKLGPDPGGQGISGVFTPEWAHEREWSYTIDGDMYAESVGVMNPIYELLTRMEASVEFAKYLFTWLTGIPLDLASIFSKITAPPTHVGANMLGLLGNSQIPGFGALAPILGMVTPGPITQGGNTISLPAILLNIPGIVVSLIGALKFLFTNAHGRYWVDPIFDGLTAEDHASRMVTQLAA
jgi:hypothetical protein